MNKHLRDTIGDLEPHATDGALQRWHATWITDRGGFAALEADWRTLQRADPDAGVFLSWAWIADLFEHHPGQWRVLILRDAGGALVAALPLRHMVHWSRSAKQVQSHLSAAGRLGFSEYTGFLCAPGFDTAAMPAIAHALSDRPWTRLSLRYEPTEHRARRFVAALDASQFDVSWPEYTINGGATNQLLCPQVALPDDFETYLRDALSANTRQKSRRMIRRHLDRDALRIEETTADTFTSHADRLLDHWYAKWLPQYGRSRARRVRRKYGDLLTRAERLGILYMPTLWDGRQMLGGLAHIVDRDGGIVHFMVAGRDTATRSVDIGLLLHLHAIRWSIETGLTRYDFGHGTEPYKYSYGAEDKAVSYFVATRRPSRDSDVLGPEALPEALKRIDGLLADGQGDAARAALRQVSALTAAWRDQPSASSSSSL